VPPAADDAVAISLYDPDRRVIPCWQVESAARDAGIAVRGGCFCNRAAPKRLSGLPIRA
jgi:hypothetical protein